MLKRLNRIINSALLTFALICVFCESSSSANDRFNYYGCGSGMWGAIDPRVKQQENPIIHGVEDIIVGFSMLPREAFAREALESMPEILRPRNMEKLVRHAITERFKPLPSGIKETVQRGCYNRKDQKITILPKRDFDKLIDGEFSKHPNTLFVIFSGYILDKNYGNKVNDRAFMYKFAIFRYGQQEALVKEITLSNVISLDHESNVIEKTVKSSLLAILEK